MKRICVISFIVKTIIFCGLILIYNISSISQSVLIWALILSLSLTNFLEVFSTKRYIKTHQITTFYSKSNFKSIDFWLLVAGALVALILYFWKLYYNAYNLDVEWALLLVLSVLTTQVIISKYWMVAIDHEQLVFPSIWRRSIALKDISVIKKIYTGKFSVSGVIKPTEFIVSDKDSDAVFEFIQSKIKQ